MSPRRFSRVRRPAAVFARLLLAPAAVALALSSCSTAYYNALEQVGIEKREILVDRVEDMEQAIAEASRFLEAMS